MFSKLKEFVYTVDSCVNVIYEGACHGKEGAYKNRYSHFRADAFCFVLRCRKSHLSPLLRTTCRRSNSYRHNWIFVDRSWPSVIGYSGNRKSRRRPSVHRWACPPRIRHRIYIDCLFGYWSFLRNSAYRHRRL